jgi:hypothetical protein
MAAASVVSKSSSSFVYEDLVSRVQIIQNHMLKFEQVLDNRYKNEKNVINELKSCSLTIIDPYGNQMTDKYLDHELMNNVIKKYKKNYIPKYLQEWIKIGTMNEHTISSLNDFQLKSVVSNYSNSQPFISFGEITVWVGGYEYASPHPFTLPVVLSDNMDKIKTQIAQLGQFTHIQLFSLVVNENEEPDKNSWNEGTILKSEDTILSCQLYKNNRVILGKIGEEKVDSNF